MKRILFIQYTNPAAYPCLEYISGILSRAGWKLIFLGTGAYGEADKLRFYPRKNVKVKYIVGYGEGAIQKLFYIYFFLGALCWCFFWRPQWIYASGPHSCPIAAAIKRIFRKSIIYHEHDTPASDARGFFARIMLSARKKVAEEAEVCILPNAQRLKIFLSDTGRRKDTFCVWNCSGKEYISAAKKENNSFDIIFIGTIAEDRIPLAVVESLVELPKSVRIQVVGRQTLGSRGYISLLKRRAQELGVSERVLFFKNLYLKQISELCALSDLGLAFMAPQGDDINLRNMVGASQKIFQYMACGLPVIISSQAEWEETFVKPGFGLSCNPQDPNDITRVISWFIDHPQARRRMGESARQKVLDDWNYEKQFDPVLQILEGKV